MTEPEETECQHHAYGQRQNGVALCSGEGCGHTWVIDADAHAAWVADGSPDLDVPLEAPSEEPSP